MTKKEILKQWLDEPKVKYCGNSNFTLGYGDGWDWVKDTLRPAISKNAMFLRFLEHSSSGSLRLGYSDYPFNRPERISLSPEWNWGATLGMNA